MICQIQGAKDAVRVDVACSGAKTQRCVALKIVVPNRPVHDGLRLQKKF